MNGLSGDIRAGHVVIGKWQAIQQPGTAEAHPYRWGVTIDGRTVRGVLRHEEVDGTAWLVAEILAAAGRQFAGEKPMSTHSDGES